MGQGAARFKYKPQQPKDTVGEESDFFKFNKGGLSDFNETVIKKTGDDIMEVEHEASKIMGVVMSTEAEKDVVDVDINEF